MWLINGNADGPALVVTGGVHAAEYASIAAALEFGRSLDPANLRGRVIVVPVMNMPSFTARSIYVCPLDGKNLNRVFPGNARGTASEQIADWVFRNVISQADYYVDLHGGDLIEALVPFTIFFRSGNEHVDERHSKWRRSSEFIIWCAARHRGRHFAPHRAPAFRRSLRSRAAKASGRPRTSRSTPKASTA